jgi:glycosyltransferase involved in cell wall biosynthesis
VIKLVNHNGFIEPSLGVAKKGFAVRNMARVVVYLGNSVHCKKINIQVYRTSYNWRNAHVKIKINQAVIHKLRVEDIGSKKFSIDLPETFDKKNLALTFSVFPQGIIKNIYKFFLGKRKPLVRDSILLSSVYLGENKVINYYDNNCFAYGDFIKQNQIPVRILGFFGQTFGLAEAARRTLASLEKSGLSISATQIPYSGKHQGSDSTIKAEKKIPSNTDDVRIFHFNGDHFDKLISDWGESVLECKYRIGFWHWELPSFPDDYLPWFDMVDEIWVPSRFVFDAIAPKSPKPVQIIPLALDDLVIKPPSPNREKFNIPKDKFVFLITFDFYSILTRKNPIAGIRAFSKLMDDEKIRNKVHLTVKVSNQHADPDGNVNLLKELKAIDSDKITLINDVLSRFDMIQLINSCDSLISLHRSEGFGLHLAEAMAMGKAVIATNWSGNTDFMNSKNSYPVDFELFEIEDRQGPYREGNHWAKASESNAIEIIKKILNSTLNQSTVETAKSSTIEMLNKNKVRTKIEQRLKWIMHNL